MRIVLNRFTASLLLLVLAPVLIPLKAVRRLTGGRNKPGYSSTLDGDPLAYGGERPVVVAVWADWATVWRVATAEVMDEMKHEFAGRCEFVCVEGGGKEVGAKYGVDVLPVVIVYHRGKEVTRFVNLRDANDLRAALAPLAVA